MQRELERRHDAEVAAAAPQGPQQVGVLVLAGADQPPVGRHDLGRDEVVDREPVAAPEPADAAAEGEPAHAGVGDEAARRRQAERLRRGVNVAPRRAALDRCAPPFWVHAHVAHGRQVDHQRTIAHRVAGDVVSATPDGNGEAVRPGDLDGRDDVGHVRDPDDDRGSTVDHRVPHGPRLVVAGIAGGEDRSPDRVVKCPDGVGVCVHLVPSLARVVRPPPSAGIGAPTCWQCRTCHATLEETNSTEPGQR